MPSLYCCILIFIHSIYSYFDFFFNYQNFQFFYFNNLRFFFFFIKDMFALEALNCNYALEEMNEIYIKLMAKTKNIFLQFMAEKIEKSNFFFFFQLLEIQILLNMKKKKIKLFAIQNC